MFNVAISALVKASLETIYMVSIASFISLFLGLILGTILHLTNKQQPLENKTVHLSLGMIVNITRSIPFIILMIAIIPFTRFVIGTTIGTNAAIVPLAIAAIPFYARITESALADVSSGLIEAAHAMGASTWQTVIKILLPESLPALIRGATLTIIGLIGYSAMAGVVGGGGLGELAINYGYQQFNVAVMIATVSILVLMVQLIQWLGDKIALHRHLKILLIGSITLLIACMGYQFWPSSVTQKQHLRIGIMSGSSEKIMAVAKDVAKNDYDINLEIVTFSDYVQPNTALNNGSIDANIFQHQPYLEAQAKAHHYQLIPIAKTFVYPMGFYSKKWQSLSDLKNKAIIVLPNDPSNEGRALLILQNAKLIKLKSTYNNLATIEDIASNPHQFQFKLLDAAQTPRALDDADLVAITNDFVGPAKLSIKQAILKEGRDSPYANLIVVRTEDKANPIFDKLISIMHSDAIIQETENIYPDGAAIPAWK